MRFLRTNTAVLVTVGPFLDKTDGVTLKTALTITNEKITLTADTDAGSAPTNILDNVTGATSGTANDLNYITGNDAALMQLELAAADTNRLGRMFLTITDAANHCPVFHEFMVMPALVYDTFFASSGGATFPAATLASTTNITAATGVDITKILGTAISTPATAGILDVNVKNIDNDAASASGTVTFPNATLASTTNITAGTITTATTATNLTNLPTIPANWLTAAGTAADFGTEVAAAVWQDAVAGDFTVASSIGKALYTGNIIPGAAGGHFIAGTNAATTITTGLTTTFTGNLTGSVASVTAGVTLAASAVHAIWDALTSALTTVGSIGKLLVDNINATISSRGTSTLTQTQVTGGAYSVQSSSCVLGDARIANLDATVSSRLATSGYTAPLDAAGTRTAVGLASANLDTQLSTIDDFLDTEIAAIKSQTDKLTFTVANQLDSNIKSVAGTTVNGVGTAGNPWGP